MKKDIENLVESKFAEMRVIMEEKDKKIKSLEEKIKKLAWHIQK